MREYVIHGTEAYAPVAEPSRLPADPKRVIPFVQEEKREISLLSVLCGAVVLVLFVGLLFSTMHLFELRSERAELRRQLLQAQTQQEQLVAEFELGIDMDAVAKQAEAMGMHSPTTDQIRYIRIDSPETVEQATEEIKTGVMEVLQETLRDMESYFS